MEFIHHNKFMMQFDKYRAWFVLFACSVAEGVKVERAREREREIEEGYSPYVN